MGEFPELERYILTLLTELDAKLVRAVEDFDFNTYVRALIDFCNEDLSAFFFDIRKDSLYCDGLADTKRNAYRSTLDILFEALIRYAAPVLVFTAEEAWALCHPERGSVHLAEWPNILLAEEFCVDTAKWDALRALREAVTEAIEPLRRDKTVRSSLEAEVAVPAALVPQGFTDEELAELFITASVTRADSGGVSVSRTSEAKCGRCWRLIPSVPEDGALCARCDDVVAELEAAQ